MPDAEPTAREWPPNDLIAGLSLKTIADPESELDENVLSGMILWQYGLTCCPLFSIAKTVIPSRASPRRRSARYYTFWSKCLGANSPCSNPAKGWVGQRIFQKGVTYILQLESPANDVFRVKAAA